MDFESVAANALSLIELRKHFGRDIRMFGFTAYAVGYLPSAGADANETARDPFLLLDWPREWLELYARQGFAHEDAVVAAAIDATEPFSWRDLQARQPGASARIFAAATEFGWNDGWLVPVPRETEDEPPGVISLAAPRLDHLDGAALARVSAIALVAFRRAEALARVEARPLVLSAREREVLALVAQGYDDTDIGEVLGLSKTTAHSYVENAKRKVRAKTRAQAVATALTQGLILL